MFECLILGDSIAVGLQQARPECTIYANSGINSSQFNKQFSGEFFSNAVIISLGTNDHKGVKTLKELEDLRKRIVAKSRVFWILPSATAKSSGVDVMDLHDLIRDIAKKNGDMIVYPHPKYISKDGIHPTRTGYEWLAFFTKGQTQ